MTITPITISYFKKSSADATRAPFSHSDQMPFRKFAENLKDGRVQTNDKLSVLMFCMSEFKSQEEIATEIQKTNPLLLQEAFDDRFVRDYNSDAIHIRAKAINIKSHGCLILDFDNGTKIEDALAELSQYELFLYTTFSHTAEHHKFRILLPLEIPIPIEEFRLRRRNFIKVFPNVDPVSFSVVQRFFKPSNPVGIEYFDTYQDGKRLDWRHVQPDEVSNISYGSVELTDRQRRTYLRGLQRHQLGHGKGLHNVRMALAWSMLKHGYTAADWASITRGKDDMRYWDDASKDNSRINNSTLGIIIAVSDGRYN